MPLPDGLTRKLQLRTMLTAWPTGPAPIRACVLFMEDLHDIERRVQNEKLAAMGRMSAAVAHEIRNPLAAIAQANALLEEDATNPTHQRLTTMIGQNAKRLGRTVEDILNLVRTPEAPSPHAGNTPLFNACVAEVVADWLQQRPQGERFLLSLSPGDAHVHFDPEHLRRVLTNLLDNAHKHADLGPQSIRVSSWLHPASRSLGLEVWSQGPAIPDAVKLHLFEPFVSSDSRSSGLGLYISRELCERYRGQLSHQTQTIEGRVGNCFTLRLPLWAPHTTDD